MMTPSTSLALCGVHPPVTCTFPSQSDSNAEPWCIGQTVQTIEHPLELPVVLDVVTLGCS